MDIRQINGQIDSSIQILIYMPFYFHWSSSILVGKLGFRETQVTCPMSHSYEMTQHKQFVPKACLMICGSARGSSGLGWLDWNIAGLSWHTGHTGSAGLAGHSTWFHASRSLFTRQQKTSTEKRNSVHKCLSRLCLCHVC